jgi:hypothetical protein
MTRAVSVVIGSAVGAAFAIIVVACGGGGGGQIDATADGEGSVSAACLEAANHSDLTWIQVNVFDKQCGFSGCHGSDSGGNTGRQSLQDGDTVASLVDQPSNLEQGETLVIPGNSGSSYMMVMLGSVAGTIPPKDNSGSDIGTMPLNTGGELLCQQKRDAIARWIDAGALDN